MGYIKKLKNNELVGGTDKTTIYPVTSTKAVFEEVTEGDKSSFKSQETINKEQQDILDNHEERIQAAEVEDIKSITINGSTKKFRVDDNNNVDLTIYTVDNDPEMPSIASNVEDLRNMVGTSTPVLETSHKTRIETLEGNDAVTGSVENKIKTKVDSINSSYQDDNNEYVKYSMTQTSGKVTNFNIDETSLKNAITSLNTSISGDNIVIRSGSTPSGTGEAGKIYRYVNSSNNTYTDYMYSGGSWVTLAIHDTSDEQAQVAYYTCTATGSGAQATKQFVSNGPLEYTPSSGGHIKILMGEANVATGTIYLQFGTTTSTKKPVYYNGEPASASNTWEAGETIAVYYDPSANNNAGAYFASNAQGGGGKAEKIKYDNSQSGLTAENVQEALDEIQGFNTLIENVNKATLATGSYRIASNKTWVVSADSHYYIPCNPGDTFRLTGGSGTAIYAFITQYSTPSYQASIHPSSIYTGDAPGLSAGTVVTIEAPSDAHGLVINKVSGGADCSPAYIQKINFVKPRDLKKVEDYVDGGLRVISAGQSYEKDESVKTSDKQLLRMSKAVEAINLSEVVHKGSLYTDGTYTYEAAADITAYNSSVEYSSGAYALYTDESTDPATVFIGKYDGSSWNAATVADMVTDGIYVERDTAWLVANAAKQNDVVQDLYSVEKKTLVPIKNLYSVWNSSFSGTNYAGIGRHTTSKIPNSIYVRKTGNSNGTQLVGTSFNKTIVEGQRYNLRFDYSNNIIDGVYFSIRNSSKDSNSGYLYIDSISLGVGTISIDFVGDSNMYYLVVGIPGAAAANNSKYVTLHNVTLSKLEGIKDTTLSEIENIWKTTGVRYYVPDADQWNPGIVKISDGSIASNSSGVYCEVDITGVKSIRAYLLSSSSLNYGTVFYDSEYNIVGSAAKSSSGWYDIAVPNGAVFMRHQCPASIEDKHLIFYYDKEGDRSNVSSSYDVPMEVGMLISTTGKNHQQSSDANSGNGYAFSSENGEFNLWRNVGMIEVEGDEYTINSDKGDYGSVFMFDSNRDYINRIDYDIQVGESVTINTSAAKYIRFTVAKKHADYPTTVYSPIAEPKCTISGKFSNGLKIAKLKKQTTSTSAGAADTIVTPVWIENTYSTKESTSQLQDTGEWHIDFGRLALPPTYDPDGEPTRLIIICHGTGSRYNPVYSGDSNSQYEYVEGAFNTDSHVTPQHILPEGYALLDMDGIFAIFNEKANSDNVIPYAMKQVANCYEAAYDFVTRNYNIKTDGVLLAGISFGGATALQIITHSNIPVIATALDSPYVCESTLWLWGYAPQWGKSVGIEGIVAGANPPENIDVLKDNYGKMLRFSPILGACHIPKDEFFATTHVEGVGDVSFETSVYYNNGWVKDDKWIKNVVYNWACRMPVPIKIWVSASDANVEPSIAGKMLYNVALNGGSDIEYRVIPGNAHTPSVGSGTTYISNYVTKYGETIASMPLVYAEMIRFFRRYEQD